MTEKEGNSAFNEPLESPDPSDADINNRSLRHHPGTKFEEYCSLNPDAAECRVYDE